MEEFFATPQKEGVVVQIDLSDHYPFPRYRVSLGFRLASGQTTRYFFPRVDGQNKLAPVLDSSFEDVGALLQRAREWIVTHAGCQSIRHIEEKVKKTGKTAKKKAK